MRCINRFRLIALGIALVSACAKRDSVALVPPSAYGSAPCWVDERGNLVAFLVLAQEGQVAVPYLISSKCLVDGTYSSDGEAVLHHLNTISLIDLDGSLHRAFPDVTLSDNLRSDQPVPSSDSSLYYFKSQVRRIQDSSKTIYVPGKIVDLSLLKMSFEQFLDLPRDRRISLMEMPKGEA